VVGKVGFSVKMLTKGGAILHCATQAMNDSEKEG